MNPIQDTGSLWPVLRELELPWGEPVADGTVLSLTHGVKVVLDGRDDGRLALASDTFYASESFFELLGGEGDPAYRVSWKLPRLDVSLEITQEDKETPAEVHLILTPPEIGPPWWK